MLLGRPYLMRKLSTFIHLLSKKIALYPPNPLKCFIQQEPFQWWCFFLRSNKIWRYSKTWNRYGGLANACVLNSDPQVRNKPHLLLLNLSTIKWFPMYCVDRLWSFSAYGWCYTSSLKALERFNVVSQHPHVQHARTAMPLGLKGDPSQAPVYCYLNCNSQPFFTNHRSLMSSLLMMVLCPVVCLRWIRSGCVCTFWWSDYKAHQCLCWTCWWYCTANGSTEK